jgi:O-glycosyl hydrolase
MTKTSLTVVLLVAAISAYCQNSKRQSEKHSFITKGKSITVYTTSDGTNQRLSLTDKIEFMNAVQPLETEFSVFVNPIKRFQTVIGIGGALTDASAETFAKLSKDKQQELIDAYYDNAKGIGYSLARTQIHSCDFSSESYTYIKEGDKTLSSFNIDPDRTYRIPLIKQVIKATGNNLLLVVSPWSPPAFMKDNNNMSKGGKLLPEYYQPWANYYVKFIKAYEKEGIPIWGLTIQNEPMATQRWESCIYTAEEERDFLKNYLGPTISKQGLANKKIIVWDHNRDLINQRANTIFDDSVAAKYAWGIGFHWYETWAGGDPMFGNVARVHEAYPSKHILFTEASVESFTPEKINLWANGERYGNSMINDFNSGASGWIDWNILLDEKGGPNHVGNFCFAPIHADTKTGQLIYTPAYYYIGHLSKFIRPNARRVSTASSRSQLLSTSFINEDDKMVTIVMNPTDKPITYNLIVGSSEAKMNILPHSIQSLLY